MTMTVIKEDSTNSSYTIGVYLPQFAPPHFYSMGPQAAGIDSRHSTIKFIRCLCANPFSNKVRRIEAEPLSAFTEVGKS
jgi:hypothetical protein